MPKIKTYSPREHANIWLRDNPCPESGTGERLVHRWILSAANAFRERRLSADQAHDLIIANLTRNEKPRGEVAEAIAKAYGENVGSKSTGSAKPKWPEGDLASVEKIVADANGFGVADLRERSPIHFGDELPHSAEVVEALLGCDDNTLICIGRSSYQFTTNSFGALKDQLSGEQFIVPSPMSARTWTKDSGELSEKGNANTGPRRNIVIEFDIAKLDKTGKPTKWAPLIDRWQAAGITVKDAMAALIWHLKQQGPLVCVVDSGGKSLHAWFYCAGESEEPGSRLRRFFEYAVAIGADPATWTRSQFVRMPDGKRDNGNRQTVLYFDTNAAERADGEPRNGAEQQTEHFNTEGTNVKTEEQESGAQASGEDEKQQTITIGKGEVQDKIAVDTNDPDQLVRITYLAMHLNAAFGSCGSKPDARAQKLWREMVTNKWKDKGVIGPDDPSFLCLAVKDPDKAERIIEALGIREANARRALQEAKERRNMVFPSIEPVGQMLTEDIPDAPEIVKSIVQVGDKMVLGGPSKARKTWILMDFGISVSAGVTWLGFETNKGRVLYVNFELKRVSFKKRALKIAASKGISADALANLDSLNLRGYAASAEEVIPKIIAKAQARNYSAIILDPTYKMLGSLKENETGDMAKLMNEFEKLATKLGVAVVFAAHFPKGNMLKRDSIDRISGSGVFARDPDTILTMTALSDKEKKQLNKQSDKPDEEKPDQELAQMLVLLKDGLAHGKWFNAVQDTLQFDKNKFNRRVKKLEKLELVEKKEDIYVKTEKGEDLVQRFKEHIESEGEEDFEDSETEDSTEGAKTSGEDIYKLEFTLRDAPPQKPIAIQFGDWTKGDYVHHRVDVDLDGFEASDEPDRQGQPEVPCTITDIGPMLCATCTKCGHQTKGYHEKKAPAGNTLKHCLATMADECPRGESNRYVAAGSQD